MLSSYGRLMKHMAEKHPNHPYYGDSVVTQDGEIISQKCFICGEDLSETEPTQVCAPLHIRQQYAEQRRMALETLQIVYRKHVLDDPSIGWDELGYRVLDTLCNIMGNDEFNKWRKQYDEEN